MVGPFYLTFGRASALPIMFPRPWRQWKKERRGWWC